jgi:hypothetical protein
MMSTVRVVLACAGVPESEGRQAAAEIEKEFNEVRMPRYTNAVCVFDSGRLTLSCDNDGWDANGLNLMDEFSDCLTAFVGAFDGDLRLVSTTKLAGSI